MNKRVRTSTTTVRTLCRTNFNLAVTLRHARCGAGFTDPDHFRLILIVGFSHIIEQFNRIFLNHRVKHILDFIGSRSLMSNDKGIKTTFVKELQPSHIQLGRSGTAPLACFQQDKAYRQARFALFFKTRHQYALRIAQAKKHVRACVLVVYPHKCSCPKRKVMTIA